MGKGEEVKKRYLEASKLPKFICPNCINRMHKGCTGGKFTNVTVEKLSVCDCKEDFNHDDSAWQLSKAQYNKLHKVKKEKRHHKTPKQIERGIEKRLDLVAQELCRFIIKERAGWKCQLAGKDNVRCSQGNPKDIMQWAHIVSRGVSKPLKYDLDNALCLCSGHHKYYTHRPDLWRKIVEKHFPKLWDKVNAAKWTVSSEGFSYVVRVSELRDIVNKMRKGIEL
jgi:hypothetical protein